MTDKTNPLINPEQAAHEVVLELAKAGKFGYPKNAADAFTLLLDHYRSEKLRIDQENKVQ